MLPRCAALLHSEIAKSSTLFIEDVGRESLLLLEVGGCAYLLVWFVALLSRELFLLKKPAEYDNSTLSIEDRSRLQPIEASAFRCYRIGVSCEGTLSGE